MSKVMQQQVSNLGGGPLVLDDIETYTPLEVKSNVAQLLAQTDWTSKQIAKVYGIPDSYLNGTGDQQSSVTQIGGQYAKSLNRYVQPIVSELNHKLNANISADIRTAIDAMGDEYASTISSLAKDGTIAGNQARFILQNSGYLPNDLPAADKPQQQAIQLLTKGGDDDGKDDSSQGIVIPNDYADVYDYLGYESISPNKIKDALNEADNEDVTLEINSPGGYVDAGSEIYTALKKYSGNINAQIVGQACSAASWIALAADNVEMSPTAQMMIHRASTVSQGNSDNLTSDLQALNSLDQSFVDLYAEKTGLDKQEVYQMMSATTWLNAQDAVDKGFADSIMFKQDNDLAIVNAAGEPALSKFAIDKIKNAIHKEPEKPKENKIENNSQLADKLAILFG